MYATQEEYYLYLRNLETGKEVKISRNNFENTEKIMKGNDYIVVDYNLPFSVREIENVSKIMEVLEIMEDKEIPEEQVKGLSSLCASIEEFIYYLNNFEVVYIGKYNSLQDYAQHEIDELYEDNPLYDYVDINRYAYNLECQGYRESNGHIYNVIIRG